MARNTTFWFALCLAVASPSLASAQGVIIQPAYATPTVQGQIYVQPQPYAPAQTYVQAQPYGASLQCPADSTLQPDCRGISRCMRLESGHRVAWSLAGAGIGMLGGGWLLEILVTAFSSLDDSFGRRGTYVDWGYVPLLGPWVQMGDLPPNTSAPMYLLLTVEGLVQGAGLIMLIIGLVGEDYEEYRPLAAGDVRVSPIVSASVQGLSIQGAF